MNREYWHCYIGPVTGQEINNAFPGRNGGDTPFREAVQRTFQNTFKRWAKVCGSGWGRTEDQLAKFDFDRTDIELKYAIVQNYRKTKKKMPLNVKMWSLYFTEHPL